MNRTLLFLTVIDDRALRDIFWPKREVIIFLMVEFTDARRVVEFEDVILAFSLFSGKDYSSCQLTPNNQEKQTFQYVIR
jgi:hypothetical protein